MAATVPGHRCPPPDWASAVTVVPPNLMTVIVVMLGGAVGAVGAVTRYLIDREVPSRHETPFPYSTVLGCSIAVYSGFTLVTVVVGGGA